MQVTANYTRKAIGIFLLITFALSSIFYFLIIHTGKIGSGWGTYVTGLMWSPGLAALITSKILKRKIALLGWQWGNTRYQLWSYSIPIIYSMIAYIIIWTTGWGRFYNIPMFTEFSSSFGFDKLPHWLSIVLYFILTGIYGLPRQMAGALGEEIGWRGFLVPELLKTMNYTKTSLITGIIHSLWHFPILLFADYNSGTPAWYGFSCFTVMLTSLSFIFTWLRLKSNSLWTCVILHASHNLFIQKIFTPLTSQNEQTKYFIDEFGAVLPIVCLCVAIYFWTRRKELLKEKEPEITV